MNFINTKTIVGTVTADTLRSGAEKINSNFMHAATALVDIQNILCGYTNDQCKKFPKLSITADIAEFQYTPVGVGDTLFHTGSGYDLALAELSDSHEAIGIIHYIDVPEKKAYITLDGYICNQSNLVTGKQYYLSNTIPGKLCFLTDLLPCDVIKPILTAISPTEAIVNIMKASVKGVSDFSIYNYPRDEYINYNEATVEFAAEQVYPWLNLAYAYSFNEVIVEFTVIAIPPPVSLYKAYSYNELSLEKAINAAERELDIIDIIKRQCYNELSIETATEADLREYDILQAINRQHYNELTIEASVSATALESDIQQSVNRMQYNEMSTELCTSQISPGSPYVNFIPTP